MHLTNVRLRDFFITADDWIFAVSGYDSTDGVQAVLRYIPDNSGDRELDGVRYRKLDFDEAVRFVEEMRPSWKGLYVPEDEVLQVLWADKRIQSLAEEDRRVAAIVDFLVAAGIPIGSMGVTGSMLPGLQIKGSDIDFVVYGNYWFTARDAIMRRMQKMRVPSDPARDLPQPLITGISDEMWHRIYAKRVPKISFDEFMIHELRKGNRGMVEGTYFDLLFVRDWGQLPVRQERGVDMHRCTIKARVTSADLAFDNPAVYEVDHPIISEILCYTHTYAGQALAGEMVEARGMMEQVGGTRRLVVGTSREPDDEWMRSLTLLGRE
ncbi:MAG: DNA polymerase subunit beta [Methanosarcinales archaeon]|nr:MAG: DNA polymerase subunit beta [Methanosarcinales archaeon]